MKPDIEILQENYPFITIDTNEKDIVQIERENLQKLIDILKLER